MPQSILRNEDFKAGALFNNVRGVTYKNSGSPVNKISSPSPGAIYIDDLTGQLWIATASGDPATWRPYFSEITNNIRIDSDVQDGDMIGIFGLGSWAVTGNISSAKQQLAGAGAGNAAWIAGGFNTAVQRVTELYNGTIWSTSGLLSITKNGLSGTGAQNAGLIAGGATISARTNLSELFDGSAWATSGTLSIAKYFASMAGTTNAALFAGGQTVSGITAVSELFNGATWAVGSNISVSRYTQAGSGAQNAAFIAGGFGSANLSSVEIFNGSAWSLAGQLSVARASMMGSGSQNSGFAAGGNIVSRVSTTELFNGSSWATSGALSVAKYNSAAAGSQNAGLVAGGITTGATRTSEFHTQSIYRKLTYSSLQSAQNIGMAYNVTTTSLTASLMRGDLPSTYIPGNALSTTYSNNVWFGISRFNNPETNCFVSSATATISTISSSLTNQATLNLSTAITTGFALGGVLLISNGTKVPIIGGTALAPLVRWENVSSSASSSLTVSCLWGQRIKYNSVNITSSGTQATITQVTDIQLPAFYKGRVGDALLIPYSSSAGANGSTLYAGTYLIQDISYPTASTVAYLISLPFSVNNISESTVGGVTLLQQTMCRAGAFSAEFVALGYRNKMRNPMNPIQDDLSNGLI